jgi:hypothetical protein
VQATQVKLGLPVGKEMGQSQVFRDHPCLAPLLNLATLVVHNVNTFGRRKTLKCADKH